jgi:hypothetical protein
MVVCVCTRSEMGGLRVGAQISKCLSGKRREAAGKCSRGAETAAGAGFERDVNESSDGWMDAPHLFVKSKRALSKHKCPSHFSAARSLLFLKNPKVINLSRSQKRHGCLMRDPGWHLSPPLSAPHIVPEQSRLAWVHMKTALSYLDLTDGCQEMEVLTYLT